MRVMCERYVTGRRLLSAYVANRQWKPALNVPKWSLGMNSINTYILVFKSSFVLPSASPSVSASPSFSPSKSFLTADAPSNHSLFAKASRLRALPRTGSIHDVSASSSPQPGVIGEEDPLL